MIHAQAKSYIHCELQITTELTSLPVQLPDWFERIKGVHPLLAIFLIVVESLLGGWLLLAKEMIERLFAGSIMALLLIAFLFVLLKIPSEGPKEPEALALGRVSPATKDATEKEIQKPEPESIPGPDRSYMINRPPENWVIKEFAPVDWVLHALEITKPSPQLLEQMRKGPIAQTPGKILVAQSKRRLSVIPIPGKTRSNGRLLPSALGFWAYTRLSVVPLNRFRPPFFIDHSLEQNFVQFIMEILSVGVVELRRLNIGTTTNTGYHYVQVELGQDAENIMVDGEEMKTVSLNTSVIGIRGHLRDYIIVMNYTSLPATHDRTLDQDLQTLRLLADSFRPLKPINLEEEFSKMEQDADQKFMEVIDEAGINIFRAELGFLIERVLDWDLNIQERRLDLIKLLEPFETLARQTKQYDGNLDSLFESMHRAKEGDASTFKALFEIFRESYRKGTREKSQEELALEDLARTTKELSNAIEASKKTSERAQRGRRKTQEKPETQD